MNIESLVPAVRMRLGAVAWAAAVLPFALDAAASGNDPASFSHLDWELACDNIRTCRAAGYQAEDGDSDPVSMQLTRTAGPRTGLEIRIQVGEEHEGRGPFRLRAGAVDIRGVAPEPASLDAQQVRRLLPELMRNDQAVVTAADGGAMVLSLRGLQAVLLKMDEAQGRLDTPGALVRRGGRSEASVPPAPPAPVVRAVRPPPSRATDAALAARIFPALDLRGARESCNRSERLDAGAASIARLTGDAVLVSIGCGVGAYNYETHLWIANDKPPFAPRAVDAAGDFDSADGSVTSVQKGRGIGDCIWSETFHFDGVGFVRSGESGDTLCRGFAGGAWNLPRYVSRVEFTGAGR